MDIGKVVVLNLDEIGVVFVDYLMYLGYVIVVYFWLKMVVKV